MQISAKGLDQRAPAAASSPQPGVEGPTAESRQPIALCPSVARVVVVKVALRVSHGELHLVPRLQDPGGGTDVVKEARTEAPKEKKEAASPGASPFGQSMWVVGALSRVQLLPAPCSPCSLAHGTPA